MRRRALLVLACALAAAPPAQASLIVLTFHPVPDAADPLGVDFLDGRDAFATRYGNLAENGIFPFPSVVVDGITPVLGLPNATRPYVDTLQAYEAAHDARAALESPLTLRISADVGAVLSVVVNATPTAPLGPMRAWLVVVEDHVAFRPPPAVSNGVFDHRFTVRAVVAAGEHNLDGAREIRHEWALPSSWSRDRLYVAAWFEGVGSGLGRFEPGEVVQAALHKVGDPATTHAEKGVLLEMYSATWCDTCLYGDRAAADLAEAHPAAAYVEAAGRSGYLVAPQNPAVALAVAILASLAVAWWARRAT